MHIESDLRCNIAYIYAVLAGLIIPITCPSDYKGDSKGTGVYPKDN